MIKTVYWNCCSIEAVFGKACRHLADWFDGSDVSCYRVIDGETELQTVVAELTSGPAGETTPSEIPTTSPVYIEQIPMSITIVNSPNKDDTHQHWVPFFAGRNKAGVLVVGVNKQENFKDIDATRVLTTVSEQLSLYCSKQLVQEQMLNARLTKERNELAAEIHDSLAQTLLALRYQVTLLSEQLKVNSESQAYQDIAKIANAIEEANVEIRSLIRQNRTPLTEHRYSDSLQALINQFSQSSDIPVFFQSEDPQIKFSAREESALLRIVGEALNNARKYSEASMIRVFLQCDSTGIRRLLVEDDGVGFNTLTTNEDSKQGTEMSGKRIGLAIMRERALGIGARLTIDSEPGEGTRVSITIPPLIVPPSTEI